MASKIYSGWRCSSLTFMASQYVLFQSYFVLSMLLISCSIIAQSSSLPTNSTTDELELLKRCPPNLRKSLLRAAPWGTCYEFHTDERTWSNANHECRRNGGNLVTIKEEQIQNFVYRALIDYRWPKKGLWIGATDSAKEMDWKWVTGERVKDGYSKWAKGQPSCGLICLEDCAIMRWKEAGKWHDYHCSMLEDYSFICEYKMLPITTTHLTTTASTTTPSTEPTTPEPTTTETSELTTTEPLIENDFLLEHLAHSMEEKPEYNAKPAKWSINSADDSGGQGVKSAHQGEVSDEAGGSLGQGLLSALIIGILILLTILILLLVLFRRRRRSQEKEDEPGVSYANPFYGEAKRPLTAESPSRWVDGSDDDEVNLKNKSAEMNFVHEGTLEREVFFNPQPPVRTRHAMNHYDKPPTRYHVMKSNSATEKNHDLVSCYDDVNGHLLDGAYDSPRSFDAKKSLPETPCDEEGWISEDVDLYQNEENIYESVDNLQQRLTSPGLTEPRLEDLDDTRYVPFVLDGEKDDA